MKDSKFKYIFIILILIGIIGAIIYFITNNNTQNNEQTNSDTSASRTSVNTNIENQNNEVNQIAEAPVEAPKENGISSFSTVIGDNSAGRLTNIRITCSIISGTIINPGETFSFNKIVGKPTVERGYQEAKVIIDHKTETGIGGGNCQVSSTLYNAVLAVPTLTIIERSEHGKEVGYVPKGKDAAVSYGSLDFKFRNDNNYKIRIDIGSDDKNIIANIVKVDN